MYTCDRCKKDFCSSQRLNTHVNRKFKCKEYIVPIIHDVILIQDNNSNILPPISSNLLQNPPNLEEEIVKIINMRLKKSENNECEYCKKVFSRVYNRKTRDNVGGIFYLNGFQNSGCMRHMDVIKQGKT
jgi:hypothetical protein